MHWPVVPNFSCHLSAGTRKSSFGWKAEMKIALGKYNKQSEVTGCPLKLPPTACITELFFCIFQVSKSLHNPGLEHETPMMGKAQKNYCLSTHHCCLPPMRMSDTPCSLHAVGPRLLKKCEKITPIMKASFPITILHHRTTSLRSKRFRLVSKQRKTEERNFQFGPHKKWYQSKKMKEGAIFRMVFDSRSPFFVPNRTEMLATQATELLKPQWTRIYLQDDLILFNFRIINCYPCPFIHQIFADINTCRLPVKYTRTHML